MIFAHELLLHMHGTLRTRVAKTMSWVRGESFENLADI